MPTQSFTADQAAAQIDRNTGTWVPHFGTPVTLTYAYRATEPSKYPVANMGGFTRFTASEIGVAQDALRKWSDVANITFTRVGSGTTGEAAYSDSAALLLGNFTTDAATVTTFDGYGQRNYTINGGVYDRHAQVWMDGTESYLTAPVFPNGAWRAIEHEIGHAIGLSHPGDYDASTGTPTYAADAVYVQDSFQYTIMSYFSETNTGANFGRQRPLTPMLHDIAAAQLIYGANMSTRTGDTIYGFHSNTGDQDYTFGSAASERVFCIWDAGGNDTIDASGYGLTSVINLNQGAFSSIGPLSGSATQTMINNISIAYGAVIENAIGGGGADTLTGNQVANTLTGNDGADTLIGGKGNDLLIGGTGDDRFIFAPGDGADIISDFTAGGGTEDKIDLRSFTYLYTLKDVLALTAQSGANAVMDLGNGDQITLSSVNKTALSADDFLLIKARPVLGSSDYDLNGHGDILWRNDDGRVSIWDNGRIDGAHVIANPGVVAASWSIAGSGNFDGTGGTDILWRNDDGRVSIWDNGDINHAHNISGAGVVANSWQVAGTGDFDANSRGDILWRNDNGVVSIWDNGDINRAHVIAGAGVVPAGWQIAGTGNFDGLGGADILWRNDDGRVSIWDNANINQAHIIANAGAVADSWHIAAIGDFDGNSRADILWRNDNGAVSIWNNGDLNGAHIVAGAGAVASSWHVAGVGNFDGVGGADILWRNDNGAASIWDNGTIAGAHLIVNPGAVSNDWHIA